MNRLVMVLPTHIVIVTLSLPPFLVHLTLLFSLDLPVDVNLFQLYEELNQVSKILFIVYKGLTLIEVSLSVDNIRRAWPTTSIWLDSTPCTPDISLELGYTVHL